MSVLNRFWHPIRDAVLSATSHGGEEDSLRRGAQAQSPVIWLLGKTGAGKTSIIHALTGAEHALIGNGFEPCTRTSSVFDFPAEVPLVRFMDTRGLGEIGYDPAADLAFCAGQAHLIVAVLRVKDPSQRLVLDTVLAARRKNPDWPLIVAQTTLHECYLPGADHPALYPFEEGRAAEAAIPPDLRACLAHQRALFSRVPGNGAILFVALDFTQPIDGFSPADYGVDALRQAIESAAPEALATLVGRAGADQADAIAKNAHSLILGYALAAMGSGAIPVPFVDAAAIAAIIAVLLRTLSERYQTPWTSRTFAEFTACLGSGVLLSQIATYALREAAKLIPVWGQTAGLAMSAAAAFTVTYALGRAACVYLGRREEAAAAIGDDVREEFREALRRGFVVAKQLRRQAGAGAQNRGTQPSQ
jgi:uncharacterized protein (DUF697 family)